MTSPASLATSALARWSANPATFVREVLGIRLWRRQEEILHAVHDHRRVAVRSGHKCGNTTALACLALWWVCTRHRARVIMTAASYRQVESVLWREVRRLHRGAPVPLGGEMHESPESGLQWTPRGHARRAGHVRGRRPPWTDVHSGPSAAPR